MEQLQGCNRLEPRCGYSSIMNIYKHSSMIAKSNGIMSFFYLHIYMYICMYHNTQYAHRNVLRGTDFFTISMQTKLTYMSLQQGVQDSKST